MDRELEEQIDELIQKATKDLKTRICRVVIRHQNKLLKDQARELKSGSGTVPSRRGRRGVKEFSDSSSKTKKAVKKDDKYYSDSDSDGYYSG
jgi:hypothetical protein